MLAAVVEDQIKAQLAEHDKRLAVVETKVDVAQGDIAMIKTAVERNNELIAKTREDVLKTRKEASEAAGAISGKLDSMRGEHRGVVWIVATLIALAGVITGALEYLRPHA